MAPDGSPFFRQWSPGGSISARSARSATHTDRSITVQNDKQNMPLLVPNADVAPTLLKCLSTRTTRLGGADS